MRRFTTITILVPSLLALTGPAAAFWRMSCSVIQTGRIDPIVSPGSIASHVHKISGPSNFGLSSTYDTLQTAPCTSCEIQADKSAYWTPQLYYEHSNGSFEEVVAPGMAVYYLGRGDNTSDIQPFPKGLRMLSGDALRRSYDSSTLTYLNLRPVADRVSFACLDTSILPETPGMVHTQCKNGLRAQIHFQSCWNGQDLYKADNSHVAYMSNIDNGVCPPGYPVHLMHLFFEVLYSVANINQDGGRFVFSNGDPTGYGFHADFMNGWDEDVLTAAINQCATGDASGAVNQCPPLVTSDINNFYTVCPVQPPIINEPTLGMISQLPGCITITDGPEEATPADINCPANTSFPHPISSPKQEPLPTSLTSGFSTVVVSSTTSAGAVSTDLPSVGSSTSTGGTVPRSTGGFIDPIDGYIFAGCYSELTGGARALSSASYTDPVGMTVNSCIDFCEKKGFGFAGVEYSQECYCGFQITTPLAPSGACYLPCKGNSSQICGGYSVLDVYESG